MRIGPAFLQTFSVQLIQAAASLVTGILVARGLGPGGQGQYAVFVAIVGLLSTFAAAGQFEGHVLTSAGQREQGKILVIRSALQSLAAVAFLVVGQGLWRPFLSVKVDGSLHLLLSLVLGSEVLALLFRGINLGQHHVTAYNVAALTQRLVQLLLTGLLYVTNSLTVASVLQVWLGAVGVNVVFSGVWIWLRSDPVSPTWSAVVRGWGGSLVHGLRALVTICLTLLLLRIDFYMLAPELGVHSVGQLSVAYTLAEYLWYIPSILGSLLFTLVAANRGPDIIGKVAQSTRTATGLLFPVTMILVLLGRWLVPLLYGGEYNEAGILLVLLLPGMFALAVHLVLDSYFAGLGFPVISYASVAMALVIKVALNLMLLPRFGAEGAVVSTSFVYIGLLTTKIIAFSRRTGTTPTDLLLPTPRDLAATLTIARAWVRGMTAVRGG